MRRTSVAAIATTLVLAGCPLPQPLPTYPAGTITPPRILSATTTSWGVDSITPVPAGCATTAPTFPLDASVLYQASVTAGERVEARWFVDYRRDIATRFAIQNSDRDVPPNPDPLVLERKVPTFIFAPYGYAPPTELGNIADWSAAGIVHVVELVVSNGFDTSPTAPQPNRSPGITPDGASQFEIQTYRWTFVNVAGLPCPTP